MMSMKEEEMFNKVVFAITFALVVSTFVEKTSSQMCRFSIFCLQHTLRKERDATYLHNFTLIRGNMTHTLVRNANQ